MRMSKIAVDAGKLNRRITIQKQTATVDAKGNQIQTWQNFYTCYAAVNGVSGREYWQARQAHEESTVSFRVRFCEYLKSLNTVDYRIAFGGRAYNIIQIDNVLFADSLLNIKGVEAV